MEVFRACFVLTIRFRGEVLNLTLAMQFSSQRHDAEVSGNFHYFENVFLGGTLDVSLLRVGGGTAEVLSSSGDAWLGGDDFDVAIAR